MLGVGKGGLENEGIKAELGVLGEAGGQRESQARGLAEGLLTHHIWGQERGLRRVVGTPVGPGASPSQSSYCCP